jgi:hypothetical protein
MPWCPVSGGKVSGGMGREWVGELGTSEPDITGDEGTE